MKVPSLKRHEATTEFLWFLEENGYQTLYKVGETYVVGRKKELGGTRHRVNPGDTVAFTDEGELVVSE